MNRQYLVSEKDVKEVLNIHDFRELSKDKVMEFISLIPNMDKELAISTINQMPTYVEFATSMLEQLKDVCSEVIESNERSQIYIMLAYNKILDDLSYILKQDSITEKERNELVAKMVEVADKISEKDKENKDFLAGLLRYKGTVIMGSLFIGAAILGVNVKNGNLSKLLKQAKYA